MRVSFGLLIASLVATPAFAGDPCGPGHMRKAKAHSGVLELRWEGKIIEQMAADIAAESTAISATCRPCPYRCIPAVALSTMRKGQ